MSGDLVELPAVPIEGHVPTSMGNEDHPMRHMTRRAAGLAPGGWDEQARLEVAMLFDALAEQWHTRTSPGRSAIVADALDRGLPEDHAGGDLCVELGSGIGTYTSLLAERWGRVVAVDLALEMLLLAPPAPGHRVRADSSDLPLGDGVADALVLVNSFLFPAEVDRVLSPTGVVVWVNSSGPDTPIHLRADEVVDALPGAWSGIHSGAGAGTWCVVRRAERVG